MLTAVSTFVGGVRFGPPGGVHVNVEALDNFGQRLGGSSYLLAPGSTLMLGDVLLNLGIPVMEDGQIRVRKTGGGDLLWGYLATATTDSDLVIIRGLVP